MIVALSAGRDAPAELRNRLALDEQGRLNLLKAPRPGIAELVVLSTCHRTELYATGEGPDADMVHTLAAVMPGLLATDQHDMRFMQGIEAVEHLFRVAAGLDSLVIGEPQVLGQVRRALALAERAGAAGPVLSNIFGRAIRLGRRVRVETALGKLGESIGSIVAEYLADRFGSLSGRRAALIGTGEAAADAARALWKNDARVSIVGRTLSSAEDLAQQIDGEAFGMTEVAQVLSNSEFALVAVSGGQLLEPEQIPVRDRKNPFLFVDLSVPTAISAAGRADIEVRTLEDIPGPRGPEVTEAMIDAEALVKKEVADLEHWADTRASGPLILELHSWAERLAAEEAARTTASWNISVEQQEQVKALAERIAKKLLHGPTTELRRADESVRTLLAKIFQLNH